MVSKILAGDAKSAEAFLRNLDETRDLLAKQLETFQNQVAKADHSGGAAAPVCTQKDVVQPAQPQPPHLRGLINKQEDLLVDEFNYYTSTCAGYNGWSLADDNKVLCTPRRVDVLLDEEGGSPCHIQSPEPHRWVHQGRKVVVPPASQQVAPRLVTQNNVLRGKDNHMSNKVRNKVVESSESHPHCQYSHSETQVQEEGDPQGSTTVLVSQDVDQVNDQENDILLLAPEHGASVTEHLKAVIADKVFDLVIDKYSDDYEGDVGCVFQRARCRLYSNNVYDICNTNVILRPALLVRKMTRHGYFENALRRILPSYQKRLADNDRIYVVEVNGVSRDLAEMFYTLKAARSLVLSLIITRR
ncbi:unnamed protein product [Amoebophrya sp. A25]|nr:unnamed protein product [Amoebophrya sp. A25]|eukprot:GSA25T00009203001.1